MAIEYADIINSVQEKGNMGGAWQQVYFAPWDDFASFATIPAESGTRNFDTMNLLSVGADTLKPGKKLYKFYNTAEKVSLKAAKQGEVDGISSKVSLQLFNPGLTSAALAFGLIPNQSWIFYVREGDKMFRVGGPAFPAKMAAEGETGTGEKTADLKGNQMTFWTYEVGFAPQVVDINAILALVNSVDTGLTVVYSPANAATGVAVTASPTITFGEAVIDASTGVAFTNPGAASIVTLSELDFNGNIVASKPFAGSIVGNVITVDPTTNFNAATLYELKIDATRILSLVGSGSINGASKIRFLTA
jgi:hypothetical protein